MRWRRHRDLDTNLHHLLGFWIALPLFVLSLTGAWIVFPALFGGRPVDAAARMARICARPVEHPVQPPAAVLANSQALASGRLTSIDWPTDRDRQWKLAFKGDGAPKSIVVADATRLARADRKTASAPDPTARLARRIHDGDDMGIIWQVVIFLGGILPATLTITGVIMWWRARNWRRELAVRLQSMFPTIFGVSWSRACSARTQKRVGQPNSCDGK